MRFFKSIVSIIAVFALIGVGFVSTQSSAYAISVPYVKGVVSFTFDDARLGIYQYGAPTLKKYGIRATFYGVSDYISKGYYKNMNWDQVKQLKTKYKWEVANHTKSHKRLTDLSDDEIREQIEQAHAAFVANGIVPETLAYPFGAVDDRVVDIVSDYYPVARMAWLGKGNQERFEGYGIRVYRPRYNQPASEIIQMVEKAVKNGEWLVLNFHNIVPDNPGPYEYKRSELDKIAQYIYKKGYRTATIKEAMSLRNYNSVKNGNFDKVAGDWVVNWTRNNPSNIVVDNSGKGAYPSVNSSVYFKGSSQKDIIRSDQIRVWSSNTYLFSMFVRMENYKKGGLAVWVNEYDAAGRWVSGQWLGGIYKNYIGKKVYVYRPTSYRVARIQIAIYTNANSDLDAYVDSVSLVSSNKIFRPYFAIPKFTSPFSKGF